MRAHLVDLGDGIVHPLRYVVQPGLQVGGARPQRCIQVVEAGDALALRLGGLQQLRQMQLCGAADQSVQAPDG
jgi:hypothetical protein